MTRKYKQAAKRRNKTVVQKYRYHLNQWYQVPYKTPASELRPPTIAPHPSLWHRLKSWLKR